MRRVVGCWTGNCSMALRIAHVYHPIHPRNAYGNREAAVGFARLVHAQRNLGVHPPSASIALCMAGMRRIRLMQSRQLGRQIFALTGPSLTRACPMLPSGPSSDLTSVQIVLFSCFPSAIYITRPSTSSRSQPPPKRNPPAGCEYSTAGPGVIVCVCVKRLSFIRGRQMALPCLDQ